MVLFQGVDSDGLDTVLKAMYTPSIQLSHRNIVSVLTTAHFLQMKYIIELCERFMMENMLPSNCLQYLKLAEVYSLDNKILQAAEDCFLKNFEKVCQDENFLELSKDAMCKYLNSSHINCKEMDILNAAVKWLNYEKSRKQWAPQVLGCVRLAMFKTSDLISEVLNISFVKNNSECRSMVHEALQYTGNSNTQPLYTGKLNKARASDTIVLFEEGTRYQGRYQTDDANNKVHFCGVVDGRFDIWSETVDVPFAFYSAYPVVCNNFLFVHGVDGRYMGNVMLRFDGSTKTWLHLTAVPQQATVGYIAALVNRSIILAGGLLIERDSTTTVALQNIMKRTFCYSIENNEWKMVEMLPHKVAFGAGCTVPNRNVVLLTGGYTDINAQVRKSNRVIAYDADKNIWITKPPLRNPRVQHSCIAFQGKIYVTGGGGTPEPEVMETCEIFCPVTEQWSMVRSGIPIKGTHQVVFRNLLLGFVGKKPVLRYAVEKNKWKRSDFQSPCKVILAAVIKVPKPP